MDALSEVGSTSIVTDALPIRAPATGTLVGWTVMSGAAVLPGEPLGYIELAGAFARPRMVVRAPVDGTVVVDGAMAGDYVATGAALAVATDLTRGAGDHTGRRDPRRRGAGRPARRHRRGRLRRRPPRGVVVDAQRSTADATGPLPASSATGEFQKVTQVFRCASPCLYARPRTRARHERDRADPPGPRRRRVMRPR